jgi:hypothetical protein
MAKKELLLEKVAVRRQDPQARGRNWNEVALG